MQNPMQMYEQRIQPEGRYKAFEGKASSTGGMDSIAIQICFVLAWTYLALGYYKSHKRKT